jgi:hypothetical protein
VHDGRGTPRGEGVAAAESGADELAGPLLRLRDRVEGLAGARGEVAGGQAVELVEHRLAAQDAHRDGPLVRQRHHRERAQGGLSSDPDVDPRVVADQSHDRRDERDQVLT